MTSIGHNVVALSCVCVGVGTAGATPMLAKVAIADYRGQIIYEAHVRPTMAVVDYRTSATGIDASHLSSNAAVSFASAQRAVAEIIRGKILLGHKLWLGLCVLGISHPAVSTRDVALYMPFRNALRAPTHIFDLPALVWSFMLRKINCPYECPAENARGILDLYRANATQWEASVSTGAWASALPPNAYSRCYL